MGADEAAEQLLGVVASGRIAFAQVFSYRIGDNYEHECIASGLTVSREHTLGLHRHGDAMRCVTHFPPEMVPAGYHDRVTDTGVVPIGLEFRLADVVSITERDPA